MEKTQNKTNLIYLCSSYAFICLITVILFKVGGFSIIHFNSPPIYSLFILGFSILLYILVRVILRNESELSESRDLKGNFISILIGILLSFLNIFVYVFFLEFFRIPRDPVQFIGPIKIINIYCFLFWNLMLYLSCRRTVNFLNFIIIQNNEPVELQSEALKSENDSKKKPENDGVKKENPDEESSDPLYDYYLSRSKKPKDKNYWKIVFVNVLISFVWIFPLLFAHTAIDPKHLFLTFHAFVTSLYCLYKSNPLGKWFGISFILSCWFGLPWY